MIVGKGGPLFVSHRGEMAQAVVDIDTFSISLIGGVRYPFPDYGSVSLVSRARFARTGVLAMVGPPVEVPLIGIAVCGPTPLVTIYSLPFASPVWAMGSDDSLLAVLTTRGIVQFRPTGVWGFALDLFSGPDGTAPEVKEHLGRVKMTAKKEEKCITELYAPTLKKRMEDAVKRLQEKSSFFNPKKNGVDCSDGALSRFLEVRNKSKTIRPEELELVDYVKDVGKIAVFARFFKKAFRILGRRADYATLSIDSFLNTNNLKKWLKESEQQPRGTTRPGSMRRTRAQIIPRMDSTSQEQEEKLAEFLEVKYSWSGQTEGNVKNLMGEMAKARETGKVQLVRDALGKLSEEAELSVSDLYHPVLTWVSEWMVNVDEDDGELMKSLITFREELLEEIEQLSFPVVK
jgi:hypothetical protein